jgi:hypothetical protein
MSLSGNKGGSSPSTQTVTQQTVLPDWMQKAMQTNIGAAQNLAQVPYTPNPVEQVAPINGQQQAAWNFGNSNVGTNDPAFAAAENMASTAGMINPQSVTPQTYANGLSHGGLDKYMDPYTQKVIDATQANMQQQFGKTVNGLTDNAITNNAFGGTRDGVVKGSAASQEALNEAQLAAQLNQANYGQATQLMGQDIGNDLSSQNANAQNQLGYQKGLTAASLGLTQDAQARQAGQSQDYSTLTGIGAQQQGQQQNVDQANNGLFNDWLNYPSQQLNNAISATANTPFPKSTATTSPVTGNNTAVNGLGGALAGAGLGSTIAGATGLSAGAAGGVGSLLGGLLGIFSDENEKTDIKKLGTDPNTGVDISAFRYKGDPKSYPKVVGPMAQDVEKASPGSTMEVGGKRVIAGSSRHMQIPKINGLRQMSRLR